MTEAFVVGLGRDALLTILLVSAPMLGFALVTGLVISLFQAVTQINEQTLAFVPKIVAVMGAGLLFGPWMLHTMTGYTVRLLTSLPGWIH